MIFDFKLMGALGAGFVLGIVGAHWSGRAIGAANARAECADQRAEAAGKAVEALGDDRKTQRVAGAADAAAYEREIVRLRAALNQRSKDYGDASGDPRGCYEPSDGKRLHDSFDSIFGEDVRAGPDLYGAERASGAPALETGRGAER